MVRVPTAAAALCFILGLLCECPAGARKAKPLNLNKVNTAADEDDPFVVGNNQALLYTSNASGTIGIMQSLWSRGWQAGKAIPARTSKEGDFRSPFYREEKLYFATNEVPDEKLKALKNFDIKVSTAGREPLPLPGISTKDDELNPWITRDGKEFYFSRKVKDDWCLFVAAGPVPGPVGDPKRAGFPPGFHHASLSSSGLIMYLQGPMEEKTGLFRCRRATVRAKWSKPEALTMLNHPAAKRGDMSPCVSSDGKKLYFASDRPGSGGLDLWVVDTSQLTK